MSLLTDQIFATGVSLNDLIHIVVTGDTTQNPAGSSFKASLNQVLTLISGATYSSGDYLPLSGGTVTGNTYFGVTSGITIDQVNDRIGVGTSNPQYTLEIYEGSGSVITYKPTAGGTLELSGSTDLPRYSVGIAPSGANPLAGMSVGVRDWDDVTYPAYGAVGDSHLYASNASPGLNIINREGTSTPDYIRFYAGSNATNPSDVHIQGSGTTRGYVGFGTENPTTKVDVVGTTKTETFQMTSGATQGYVLVDNDGNGNAKWTNMNEVTGKNWISSYSTVDQTLSIAGTTLKMSADTSSGNGITLSAGTKFVVSTPGVYNIQFSAQLEKNSGTKSEVYIWLIKNGTNQSNSNTQVTLDGANGDRVVASWNFVDETDTSNTYYEIGWTASDSNTFISYDATPTYGPAIPSVIITITQI